MNPNCAFVTDREVAIDISVMAIVIPSCESPNWKVVTRPLLDLISELGNMTTTNILRWGKSRKYPQNFTRNILAWLAFNDLVIFDDTRGTWAAH